MTAPWQPWVVNAAPEHFNRAQRITQRAPGDSSQAEDGASPRTGSNYPPFQNRWLRYRRAAHRNSPICVELWDVRAVQLRRNLTGHRRERRTWLSGIINHSLCPRWRGGGKVSVVMSAEGGELLCRLQQVYNPPNSSMGTPPKTSAGSSRCFQRRFSESDTSTEVNINSDAQRHQLFPVHHLQMLKTPFVSTFIRFLMFLLFKSLKCFYSGATTTKQKCKVWV